MNNTLGIVRRAFGIGLAWAILWLVFWQLVGLIIEILVPGSIDPGEGSMIVLVLGPMGFFIGVAFAVLLSPRGPTRTTADLPLIHVVAGGTLATAIVQLGYLGHGDQGLAANIKMALLFSAVGGLVTLVWLVMARRWVQWRSSRQASS